MGEWLLAWIPEALTPFEAYFLIALSGCTSMITATLGIGGGALLLVVMAQILPLAALIPVHGLVQLGSNANRALLTRDHIDYFWIKRFVVGSFIGALIALFVVVQLPLVFIQLSIGGFILWLTWAPKPKQQVASTLHIFLAGILTTFVSMFVGATGPLVGGLIHRRAGEKLTKVATMAASLTVQHGLKVLVFVAVGFVFTEWLVLIILMIASGALGTWIGIHLLKRLSSEIFSQIFKWMITLLALRLIYQAVSTLLA